MLNLIVAALSTIGAALALFRKKEDDDEEDDYDEDMSLPMAMTDKWTLLMAALLAGQVGTAVANKKASESDEDDEEGAEA